MQSSLWSDFWNILEENLERCSNINQLDNSCKITLRNHYMTEVGC